MSEFDKKTEISEIIGIENSAGWMIKDSNEEHSLKIIHHRPEADLLKYGNIRGIVVDTKAKCIVSDSFPYAPIVKSSKLTLNNEGYLKLVDEFENQYILDPEKVLITEGFEGTVLHIFKHDGKVFYSTRKKLDSSNSRWGNSETFSKIYSELGGPSEEELFDKESKYSPYSYMFILVHPSLLVCTKDNVGKGYIVYLGYKTMWSVEYYQCPYKQTLKDGSLFKGVTEEEFANDPRPNAGWIDTTLKVPLTKSIRTKGPSKPEENVLYEPSYLDIDSANHYLQFGFLDKIEIPNYDKRLYPGEFIIINILDENNKITKMLKVQSESYSWRSELRDNDPNLLHRFYQLNNDSYLDFKNKSQRKQYLSKYPVMYPLPEKNIISQLNQNEPYLVWPQNKIQDKYYLKDRKTRLYNIWLCFMMAVPFSRQKEVSSFYSTLNTERYNLIGWLWYIQKHPNYDVLTLSSRVKTIIDVARNYSKNSYIPKSGKKWNYTRTINDKIRNFVMKEEGTSFYRLVREMKKWYSEIVRLNNKNFDELTDIDKNYIQELLNTDSISAHFNNSEILQKPTNPSQIMLSSWKIWIKLGIKGLNDFLSNHSITLDD